MGLYMVVIMKIVEQSAPVKQNKTAANILSQHLFYYITSVDDLQKRLNRARYYLGMQTRIESRNRE